MNSLVAEVQKNGEVQQKATEATEAGRVQIKEGEVTKAITLVAITSVVRGLIKEIFFE